MPAATDQDANEPAKKAAGGRSRRGAETRARLVDAAKVVFERDGFLEARITDIAKEAGVSHGSYYHYFESKEQLFREVAELQEIRLTAPPDDRSATGHAISLSARIEAANRRYLERYRDESVIMGVIEQVSRYNDQVRSARFARQQSYTRATEDSVRRLQSLGLADPELDPTIAAQALSAMVTRFAEMWLVQHLLDCDFDEGVEQLTILCTNALQLKDRPGTKPARDGA